MSKNIQTIDDVLSRLREVIEAENLGQEDFAVQIGEGYQKFKNILGKRQKLTLEIVLKILEQYQLDAHWLLLGDGRMYKHPDDLLERVSLSEKNLLMQWRLLSIESQESIRRLIGDFADREK